MKTVMSRVAGKIWNRELTQMNANGDDTFQISGFSPQSCLSSSSACRTVLLRRFLLPWTCQTALEHRSTTKSQERRTVFFNHERHEKHESKAEVGDE